MANRNRLNIIVRILVPIGLVIILSGGCIQPFGYSPEALNNVEESAPVNLPTATTVATPVFDHAPGTYNSDLSVSITSSTSGAAVHYTIDGSVPTSSSPVVDGPIDISGHLTTITITAFAAREGMTPSAIVTGTFAINYDATNPPTFSPDAGTYTSDQTVTISAPDQGATIYYTTDGSTPDSGNPAHLYTEPIPVSGHGTSVEIRAIAVAPGKTTSSVASGTWTIAYPQAAAPVFDHAPGTYNSDLSVSITSSTEGAAVHYTIDGSVPTSSSPVVEGPIDISGHLTTITITAFAAKEGMTPSAIVTGTFAINYDATNPPTFSPAAGTYTSDQTVTISAPDPDATIYYTTDGSAPDADTPAHLYTEPIPVSGHGTSVEIRAIAVAPGKTTSSVASGTWTIAYPQAAAPTFSPGADTYTSDQTVTISAPDPDATIYYTTDGSTPDSGNPAHLYTEPIPVSGHGTSVEIRAIAVAPGKTTSSVASGTWTIAYPQAAAPTFSPAADTYTSDQTVTISAPDQGATIYYTTDGSAPDSGNPAHLYTEPVPVSGHGTSVEIRAIAVAPGKTTSSVASGTWTIAYPQAAAPVFDHAPGTYNSNLSVSITSSTAGAAVHYTIDGSVPTSSSPVVEGPIEISGHLTTITITAFAAKEGMTPSAIVARTFTINYDATDSPTFSPAAGTYPTDQTVTISAPDQGATIYYTTDGSAPDSGNPAHLYTEPIPVSGHGTSVQIRAIAVAPGRTTSSVASGTWTIAYPQAAAPTFSPAAGTYPTDQTVTISAPDQGATIYYTTDGSAPDSGNPAHLYTEPIPVSGHGTSVQIRAIAVAPGRTTSSVASGTWTIAYPQAAAPTFSPAAGTYPTDQTVTISAPDQGATIYYTTDGSAPDSGNPAHLYTEPIPVSGHGTSVEIQAIAVAPGKTTSVIASGTWTIAYPQAAAPTFTPPGGTFDNDQQLTLTTVSPGTEIRYTTDGSVPTAASASYDGPITISSSGTVRAIAVGGAFSASPPTQATFNLVAAPVVMDPVGGDYGSTVSVTLSTATAGAAVHYTLDGSAPDGTSPQYAGVLNLTTPLTLKGIAIKTGYQDSAVTTEYYVPPAAEPVTFSVPAGSYDRSRSVQLSTETPDATIHYTIDGSQPTTESPEYSGAVQVHETLTIRAIAVKPGEFGPSPETSATYTMTGDFNTTTVDDIQTAVNDGQLTVTPAENSAADPLPVGTIIYLQTDLGRLVKIALRVNNGTSTFYDYITYNTDGSIHSQGINKNVNNNQSINADEGTLHWIDQFTDITDFGRTGPEPPAEYPPESFVVLQSATMLIIPPELP